MQHNHINDNYLDHLLEIFVSYLLSPPKDGAWRGVSVLARLVAFIMIGQCEHTCWGWRCTRSVWPHITHKGEVFWKHGKVFATRRLGDSIRMQQDDTANNEETKFLKKMT